MKKRFLGLVLVGIFCFGIAGCSGENGDYRKLYEEERAKWWVEKDRNDKLDEENEDLQKEKDFLEETLQKERENSLNEIAELKIEKQELERDIVEKDKDLNYYYNSISPYLRLGDELAGYISDTAYSAVRGNVIQIYVEIYDFGEDVLYDTVYEYVYNMLDKVYERMVGEDVIVLVNYMDINGGVIFEITLNKFRVSTISDNNYSDLIKDILNELIYLIDLGEGITSYWSE